MFARKLPDLDTLLKLRETKTLAEIGAMYGVGINAVWCQLNRYSAKPLIAENKLLRQEIERLKAELMQDSKRLAWAAWREKQKRKQ